MLSDSGQPYHFGVNYIFAPGEAATQMKVLQFQQHLAQVEIGIAFDLIQRLTDQQFTFTRSNPPLQIGLVTPDPRGAPALSQILITAPNPARDVEDFTHEAEDVIRVYRQVWPSAQQIVSRDCSIRMLYAVHGSHAFQYLWEERFSRSGAELRLLERPILGGGVRFVLPPTPDTPGEALIELKLESLLSDSSQLFVDTHFTWQTPGPVDALVSPRVMLETAKSYIDGPVRRFLTSHPAES